MKHSIQHLQNSLGNYTIVEIQRYLFYSRFCMYHIIMYVNIKKRIEYEFNETVRCIERMILSKGYNRWIILYIF